MSQLHRICEDIRTVFRVQERDGRSDLLDAVFELTICTHSDWAESLGWLLIQLMHENGVALSVFYDELHLAKRFAVDRERLYGVEKITGRELAGLLSNLSKDQRILFSQWLVLAIEQDHYLEDEIAADLKAFGEWIAGLKLD